MSNRCSAANPTGVFVRSPRRICHFVCSTSTSRMMMSRMTLPRTPMFFLGISFVLSSPRQIFELKSPHTCMVFRRRITSRSRRSRSVSLVVDVCSSCLILFLGYCVGATTRQQQCGRIALDFAEGRLSTQGPGASGMDQDAGFGAQPSLADGCFDPGQVDG